MVLFFRLCQYLYRGKTLIIRINVFKVHFFFVNLHNHRQTLEVMRISILILFIFLTVISSNTNSYSNPNNDLSLLNIGDKAPDFSITDPEGKTINLHSLKGKVVFLDFWASWCQPCRMANIDIVPLYHKYNPHGFEIFSVSLDDKKDHWLNAIKNDKMVWPYHGSELKGFEQSRIAELYNVEGLPATFLIDENGVIIAKNFDDYDLEVTLHKIFFEQVNFYPQDANTKLYFTNETRYQIEDVSGKVLHKGKGTEADITHLSSGDYVLKYDKKTAKFSKIKVTEVPATFYPQRVDDKITISRKVEYEIYTQRGKLERRGNDVEVDVSKFKPGLYYISLEGTVSSFIKK
jgi:peroxiredoxin